MTFDIEAQEEEDQKQERIIKELRLCIEEQKGLQLKLARGLIESKKRTTGYENTLRIILGVDKEGWGQPQYAMADHYFVDKKSLCGKWGCNSPYKLEEERITGCQKCIDLLGKRIEDGEMPDGYYKKKLKDEGIVV